MCVQGDLVPFSVKTAAEELFWREITLDSRSLSLDTDSNGGRFPVVVQCKQAHCKHDEGGRMQRQRHRNVSSSKLKYWEKEG